MALGATTLLASLFLPWYARTVIMIAGGPPPWVTGWQAFRFADLLLAGVAGAGLALVAVERRWPARRAYFILAPGSWAAVAVVVQAAFGAAVGEVVESPPGTPFIGWLAGLAGAAAMALGSTWAGIAKR